jgi:hypothetical protein
MRKGVVWHYFPEEEYSSISERISHPFAGSEQTSTTSEPRKLRLYFAFRRAGRRTRVSRRSAAIFSRIPPRGGVFADNGNRGLRTVDSRQPDPGGASHESILSQPAASHNSMNE